MGPRRRASHSGTGLADDDIVDVGAEFVPVLIRQRDHANDHGQPDRARLFTGLLDNLDNTT